MVDPNSKPTALASSPSPKGPFPAPPPAKYQYESPTLEEMDACLRHLAPDNLFDLRLGTWMRYTGLSPRVLCALHRGDVDLDAATLRLPDTATIVPISPHLVAEVRAWGPYAFRPSGRVVVPPEPHNFEAAWTKAVRNGEARSSAWKPYGSSGRPYAAFRTAFVAFLLSQNAEPDAIMALVGAPIPTRRRKWVEEVEMEFAVKRFPPIDWLARRLSQK